MRRVRPLSISGAWEVTPEQHGTPGRLFAEMCRANELADLAGPFDIAQASVSVSARNVLRGIHYGANPPGQKKFVTCLAGEVMDVVVDLRVDSPTFGKWDAVMLNDKSRSAVIVTEGLGHGYYVLSTQATMVYLFSSVYDPGAERQIHPLDPDLGITWPSENPELSVRDSRAQSLADALGAGQLGCLPKELAK